MKRRLTKALWSMWCPHDERGHYLLSSIETHISRLKATIAATAGGPLPMLDHARSVAAQIDLCTIRLKDPKDQ